MHYFAYGSNCNPAVLEKKAVRFRSRVRASLADHRLRFNKQALRASLPDDIGFANVEPAAGETVEGVLYELEPEDLERLDASERAPEHYERVEATVVTDSGPTACFLYRAHPDKTADGLRPSRNYLNHILEAQDFLSRSYYEALERSQTYEGPCGSCTRSGEVVFVREGERLHLLCQPCREARHAWSTSHGRRLTIAETAALVRLVRERGGFGSIRELVDEAVAARVLAP